MRLEDAFTDPIEGVVIVNASNGVGLFLMPNWTPDIPRLDCLMLEWTPSGEAVRHNYENVSLRTDLNLNEWNALANKHGLPQDGWQRYVRE